MMSDDYLGWGLDISHHCFCVLHLASKFCVMLHDKSMKMLLVKTVYERQSRKFGYRTECFKISYEAQGWLMSIPIEKWALCHNGRRCYGMMITNFSEVFYGVLKGAYKPVYR